MALTSAQITICDLADPVVSGTEPENPVINMLWTDTSQSPSVLKRWTGEAWEVVNEPVVGGTNLMYGTQYWTDSAFQKDSEGKTDKGDAVVNETILTITQPSADDDSYPRSCCSHRIPVTGGEKYMLGFDVSGDTAGSYEVLYIEVYRTDSVSETEVNILTVPVEANVTSYWKRVTQAITMPNAADYVCLVFQPAPEGDTNYRYVKFEKGTVATSWSPAPEDFNAETQLITRTLEAAKTEMTDKYDETTIAINTTKENLDGKIVSVSEELSSVKQTVDTFTVSFSNAQNELENKTQWFTMTKNEDDKPVLEIGDSESKVLMNLTNEELAFIVDKKKVAYMSSDAMCNTNLIVEYSFKIGKFQAVADDSGVSWI